MPVRTHKQHRISHLPHADELEASRRRLLAMTDHGLGLSPFKTTPDKPIPSSPTIPPQYPQPEAPPSRRHGAAPQGERSARSLGSTASSSRRRASYQGRSNAEHQTADDSGSGSNSDDETVAGRNRYAGAQTTRAGGTYLSSRGGGGGSRGGGGGSAAQRQTAGGFGTSGSTARGSQAERTKVGTSSDTDNE